MRPRDLHDVQALLDRVSYKPNVRLTAVQDESVYMHYPMIKVRAEMWTLDSRQEYPPADRWTALAINGVEVPHEVAFPKEGLHRPQRLYVSLRPIKVATAAIMPYGVLDADEHIFWNWLQRAIFDALERHESREWFKVDDQVFDDPHKNDWR